MTNTIDYVKSDIAEMTVIFKERKTGKSKSYKIELLWGDQVKVIGNGRNQSEVKVKARGKTGYVKKDSLNGEPLLEVYFIDVGQGDGTMIVTPDRRHILIDGGWPRRFQPTGKNAADFVDWKFAEDYEMNCIELDTIMCSHNDQDHYGGLWDLFNPKEEEELNVKTKDVYVEKFFHAGLSWWKLNKKKTLGRTKKTTKSKFFIDLIDSRSSVLAALKRDANPKLSGEWAKFLKCATNIKTKNGNFTPMHRLSHLDQYVAGYEKDNSDVSIKVLAPVEFKVDGHPAIRYFTGGNDKNTNGNSLLLRLDYGRSRMLLTGDLNTKSMESLLHDWKGQRNEFLCDVAKSCHHGSDDVSYEFLSAMRPAVTVISSGDNEGHDHPRPSIVAASATTGHLVLNKDKIISPLVYSTELARSIKLGVPIQLSFPNVSGQGTRTIADEELKKVQAKLEVTASGQRNPTIKRRNIGYSRIVSGTIYGLVNIRTNGDKILCATMNEAKHSWEIKIIYSRF